MLPSKLFLIKTKYAIEERFPNDVGMLPVRLLEATRRMFLSKRVVLRGQLKMFLVDRVFHLSKNILCQNKRA